MEKNLIPKDEDLASRWEKQLKVADEILRTGLIPRGIRTPQQLLLVMETGREIGIPPLEALRNMYVVDSKVALQTQLMLSLLYRSKIIEDIQIEDKPNSCTVTIKRKGMTPYSVTFGEAEAKRANLLYKDNWKKYPDKMYRARAISACARVVAPDVLGGLYTIEEIESHSDTVEALGQVEKTTQITDEGSYDQWREEFFEELEMELDVMQDPYEIQQWKAGHTKEMAMLSDEDRQKVETLCEERHSFLITENPEKGGLTLTEYVSMAEKCLTVESLKTWFKEIQPEARKWLISKEFDEFVQECNFIKNRLSKSQPKIEKIMNIALKNNWTESDIIGHIKTIFGVERMEDLPDKHVETMCNYIEANPK